MSDAIDEIRNHITELILEEQHTQKQPMLQRAEYISIRAACAEDEAKYKGWLTALTALQSRAETAERERTEFAVALGDEHEICLSLIRERNEAEWERDEAVMKQGDLARRVHAAESRLAQAEKQRDEAVKFGADKLSEMASKRDTWKAAAKRKHDEAWYWLQVVGEMRHWLSIADFCSAEACEKRNELCARAGGQNADLPRND